MKRCVLFFLASLMIMLISCSTTGSGADSESKASDKFERKYVHLPSEETEETVAEELAVVENLPAAEPEEPVQVVPEPEKPQQKAEEPKPAQETPSVSEPPQVIPVVDQVTGKDEHGFEILEKLPNFVTLLGTKSGNRFFQFKLDNTGINFKERGFAESGWPSYKNTFTIDLNDSKWADFKDKRIAIIFSVRQYSDGANSTSFGFDFIPAQEGSANALYSTKGLDSFSIIEEVKTPYISGADIKFETYVLLPVEIKVGSSATITEIPSSILFSGAISSDKTYVITLRDVPKAVYDTLVDIITNGKMYYAKDKNGQPVNVNGTLQSSGMNNDRYSAEFHISGLSEEFIFTVNCTDFRQLNLPEFGSIEFREL